jgi:hypothetical protein
VRRKRGATGSPPSTARLPALQPVLYGPLAAYSLNATLADRSGAGRNMLGSNNAGTRSASLIRGAVAYKNGILQDPVGGDNVFFRNGAITVTGMYWYNAGVGAAEFMLGVTQGANGLSANWALRATASGGFVYANNNASFSSGLGFGQAWQFFAFRRNSAGTIVDLQIDTATATSAALAVATSNGAFRIAGEVTPPLVQGGLYDVMIWPSRLTDAEIEGQRLVMMGQS